MTAPVLTGTGAAHVTGTGAGFAPHRGDDRIATCVEVAWNFDPTLPFGNQWSDVTQYVRSLTTQRGRQQELQQFEAGTLSMRLSNTDGRFSPWNASGAYGSGAVRIGVPIRVRISAEKSDPTGTSPSVAQFDPTDGGFFPAWYGFITDLEPDWSDGGKFDGWCDVQAADAFALLNRADLVAAIFTSGGTGGPFAPYDLPFVTGFDAAQYSHDRFVQVVDQSGVKPLLRGLYLKYDTTNYSNVNGSGSAPYSPVVQSGALFPVSSNALAHLQDMAECGFIDLYERPDGIVAWRPYSEVRDQVFDTTTIFGDNAGEIPYMDVGPLYDDQNLYNDTTITLVDSSVQSSADNTSIAAYGRRKLQKTIPALPVVFDASPPFGFFASAYIPPSMYVTRYKDPIVRVPAITVSLRGLTDAQRMRVLSLPIGYRVQVKRRPTTGDALTAECHFEGCQLTWDPGMIDVKAVLNLAPSRAVGTIHP